MNRTLAQLAIIGVALVLAFNPGGVVAWELRILLLGLLFVGSVLLLQPRASREKEEAERIANEHDWEEQQRRAITAEKPPIPDPHPRDTAANQTHEHPQSEHPHDQQRED